MDKKDFINICKRFFKSKGFTHQKVFSAHTFYIELKEIYLVLYFELKTYNEVITSSIDFSIKELNDNVYLWEDAIDFSSNIIYYFTFEKIDAKKFEANNKCTLIELYKLDETDVQVLLNNFYDTIIREIMEKELIYFCKTEKMIKEGHSKYYSKRYLREYRQKLIDEGIIKNG